MWHRYHAAEDGIALIAALLAVVILSGVGIVLVSISVSESRATGNERDFENALHVAEAGADEVVARVNTEDDFVTSNATCDDIELDQSMSESEQRAWAVQQVDDCGLTPTQSGPRGVAYGFRPVDDTTDEPVNAVFGVSFVPTKANPSHTRVVKLQYDRNFFTPTHGVQTCGDLDIAGNAKVLGERGSVRSNGNVTISGSSYDIDQQLAASGSITGDASNADSSDAFSPDEYCPKIDVRTFYAQSADPQYTCYTNPGASGCATDDDGETILWWDLCPDGTVRQAGTTPCSGTVVWNGDTTPFNGWKYQNNDWKSPNGLSTGIYYVYQRDVDDINGGDGWVTVLVERNDTDGGLSGNLGVRGNGSFHWALESVVFMADRDITMNGSASGGGLKFNGFIGAGEQIDLSGTAELDGAIYAQDQPHTASSPVSRSSLAGNYTVRHEEPPLVPVSGVVRITAWNELRKN